MENIAKFTEGKDTAFICMYQYDYGQQVIIEGLDLPEAFKVHFSNGSGLALVIQGEKNAEGKYIADIPDEVLQQETDRTRAWIYLDDDISGKTIRTIIIHLERREQPSDMPPVSSTAELKSYADYVRENADKVAQAEQIANDLKEIAEKVELLTLDTIDTFYEEEVPSPYIVEQEQVLHNFTYDGPYEINSYEDLVNAFKYLEKNTDLLRYEFEEINVTVNGEKKSLIDSKKVCYISYLVNPVKDSGEFSRQDLVDFINALKNGTEIPDYSFQLMSNDSRIIYLSTQDSGEELYAVYSAEDDLLYANTQNEITESLGVNIQIFSDLEIKGQIYVEHYEDSIRYLYDNGYYTSKEYNPSGMLIDIGKYPYLYMNMSGISFDASGNPNYSILSVDSSLRLLFLDNFITEDLTDNPELRTKFKLNINSSDVTGTLLKFQTTFLGNIYTEHWSSNPNYRSFLGWEKVYESVFEDLNYIINESDYAKYDYMIIVYPTKSGYMPSGSAYLEYQNENRTVKSFLYYPGDAAFKRVNYINNNDAFLRVGSEYIYPSGSGSTAYASSGFETLPTGLFVRSIRYYSSNNKGTKTEIYRKRCC